MKFPNISLGRSTKTYTHNMSFDNSTTMPFGVVQPLLSQRLEPKSQINIDMRQLVRLAPMPVPSFARLYMNNEVSFVPITDVCPYYEALVSQLSYSGTSTTYYPTSLPVVSNSTLLYILLTSSDTYFSIYDGNGKLVDPTQDILSKVQKKLLEDFFDTTVSFGSDFLSLNHTQAFYNKDFAILPSGCDFCYKFIDLPSTGVAASNDSFLVCFRFGESSRRLRSVFIGLGYSLNIDNTKVSFVPILSFYKAYFDLYFPARSLSWTDTNAFKLVRYIEDYKYNYVFSPRGFSPSFNGDRYKLFLSFIDDLRNVFYVAPDDIVSIHRETPSLATFSSGTLLDYVDHNGQVSSLDVSVDGSQPSVSGQFGLVSLQVLQRLTRYFNKNSVIGKRISEYVKVHFGADVANSLYKDAFHVQSFSYPLNIDDIFSTSDTFEQVSDTKSKGELLGSYGGKGLGFDKSHFSFTAPTAGYLFILGSISTPTGYFQGNSGDLYVVDFDTVPQAQFDALGFELSPRGQFFGFNDTYAHYSDKTPNFAKLDTGFGFVPRYTGVKYHKNIVNGDLSRKSTASSLSPYHLNRILTPTVVDVSDISDTGSDYTISTPTQAVDLPGPNTAWRYLSSQPWLGDYNRIFYNKGDLFKVFTYDDFGPDDNFIVQTVFESKVTNTLKPLSQSFDTFEETTDNGTVDVKPE